MGGAEAPADLTLMLLPQKDVQNLEKQEKKKQFSGYKQCYTYKNQSLEVS